MAAVRGYGKLGNRREAQQSELERVSALKGQRWRFSAKMKRVLIHRWLSKSRYLVVLAVAGSFLCCCALLFYGAWRSVQIAFSTVKSAFSGTLDGKKLMLATIESVDILLLATVFYIVALGLYELFIDATIPVPKWMEIRTLDDLKNKLLSVVVTVLGVLFLGQALTWDGSPNIAASGAAIALVIGAITFYLRK